VFFSEGLLLSRERVRSDKKCESGSEAFQAEGEVETLKKSTTCEAAARKTKNKEKGQ